MPGNKPTTRRTPGRASATSPTSSSAANQSAQRKLIATGPSAQVRLLNERIAQLEAKVSDGATDLQLLRDLEDEVVEVSSDAAVRGAACDLYATTVAECLYVCRGGACSAFVSAHAKSGCL
jgi:hypothetical protein